MAHAPRRRARAIASSSTCSTTARCRASRTPRRATRPATRAASARRTSGAYREPEQRSSTASIALLPRGSLLVGPVPAASPSARSVGRGVRSVDPSYVIAGRRHAVRERPRLRGRRRLRARLRRDHRRRRQSDPLPDARRQGPHLQRDRGPQRPRRRHDAHRLGRRGARRRRLLRRQRQRHARQVDVARRHAACSCPYVPDARRARRRHALRRPAAGSCRGDALPRRARRRLHATSATGRCPTGSAATSSRRSTPRPRSAGATTRSASSATNLFGAAVPARRVQLRLGLPHPGARADARPGAPLHRRRAAHRLRDVRRQLRRCVMIRSRSRVASASPLCRARRVRRHDGQRSRRRSTPPPPGPADAVGGPAAHVHRAAAASRSRSTQATLHVGAVYLNNARPDLRARRTRTASCPAVYVGRGDRGPRRRLLSPDAAALPGQAATAIGGPRRRRRGVAHPRRRQRARRQPSRRPRLAGTAERDGASYPFAGTLTIGQNRATPVERSRAAERSTRSARSASSRRSATDLTPTRRAAACSCASTRAAGSPTSTSRSSTKVSSHPPLYRVRDDDRRSAEHQPLPRTPRATTGVYQLLVDRLDQPLNAAQTARSIIMHRRHSASRSRGARRCSPRAGCGSSGSGGTSAAPAEAPAAAPQPRAASSSASPARCSRSAATTSRRRPMDDAAFVDGWEVKFTELLVTVDKIKLSENPDLNPGDQSKTGRARRRGRRPLGRRPAQGRPAARQGRRRRAGRADRRRSTTRTRTAAPPSTPTRATPSASTSSPRATGAKNVNLDAAGQGRLRR